MPFATTIDNSILDHFTKKAAWTQPTAVYIGLSSTTPTKAGANVTEPSTGSYARIQVTTAEFDAAASSATSNNAEQAFAAATGDWLAGVDLIHLVIYDAVTDGNFLGFKALTVAKPVISGDTAKIPVGDLDLAIGGT